MNLTSVSDEAAILTPNAVVPPPRVLGTGAAPKNLIARPGDAMFPPINIINEALQIEEPLTVNWLAGDGSDRSYYRLFHPGNQKTYVLMQLSGSDAVALKEGSYDWISIGAFLGHAGIRVPALINTLKNYGAIIIEDYGDETFEQKVLKAMSAGDLSLLFELYSQASGIALSFLALKADPSQATREPWASRAFDEEKLYSELIFFQNHYLKPLAPQIFNDAPTLRTIDSEFRALAAWLAPFSKYFVHRDYHSRNLMFSERGLAVIDFQDARVGAAAYDLVSLVFDSYIPLDQDVRIQLLQQTLKRAKGLPIAQIGKELEQSWAAVLLQRQLKAIGSFGFLTLVKNRGNYLKYVKPALLTLNSHHIHDDRWPYLSKTLITELLKLVID